jgi:predicted acyltransferase
MPEGVRSREPTGRVIAIDVMRGLVLLILLPDTTSGFSLARLSPDLVERWGIGSVVAQFEHVAWEGLTVWDLIFPAFAFVIGASLWYSYKARSAAGESKGDLWRHAALRSFTLVLLGVIAMIPVETYLDEVVPFVVLGAGLPVARWVGRLRGRALAADRARALELAIWLGALLFAVTWVAFNGYSFDDRDFDLVMGEVLLMLGLAYFFCFAAVSASLFVQIAIALIVAGAYGLMFLLFPLPSESMSAALDPSIWANGTNASARFDLWLHNLHPRTTPFVLHSHGYHALQFVGLIPLMLAGLVAGRYLSMEHDTRRAALRLLGAAAIALAGAWVLVSLGVPVVKSIWTPSYMLLSAAICVAALAGLHWCCNRWRGVLWTPLVVLGSNAILLYLLAVPRERWRILEVLHLVTGTEWTAGGFSPVLESLWVLGTLWLFAWVLYRYKIFVRV